MAVVFWVVFAAGLALLAAFGHAMDRQLGVSGRSRASTSGGRSSPSPELMIFMYFMITDPKTVPTGRVGKVVFALLVAVTCLLLIAPQTTEFGTKVALLGGLTLMCAWRPLFDRLVPVPGAPDDRLALFASRLTAGDGHAGTMGRVLRIGMIAAVGVLVGTGVVLAGRSASHAFSPEEADVLGRVPHVVNPDTLPSISIDQDVLDWNHTISGAGAQAIVLTLAENLEMENQALLRADPHDPHRGRPRRSARRSPGPARRRRCHRRHRGATLPDRRRARDPDRAVRPTGRAEPRSAIARHRHRRHLRQRRPPAVEHRRAVRHHVRDAPGHRCHDG